MTLPTLSLAVEGYGRRARLILGPTVPAALVRSRLPAPFVVREMASTAEPERSWTIADIPDLFSRVLPELEIWVAEWAEGFVFAHAGCVEWGGRALLLPGRSLAGKSTLTRALLLAGARYMSDEYAPIDMDGLVHPYPRPLQIRDASADEVGVPAAVLGSHTATDPYPVGLVARLTYDRDGGQWTDVSPARGVLEVLDNTVCARTRPHEAMETVARAVTGARVVMGTRGEADLAAEALLRIMDSL